MAVFAIAEFPAEGRERIRRRPRPVVLVSSPGLTYLDRAAAELGAFPVDRDFTGRITMSDGTSTFMICPGMSSALLNGNAVHSIQFVNADDTGILVPKDMWDLIRDIFKNARIGGIRKIVLDAGHGGRDHGATGKTGLREKDVNLSIVLRLAQDLRERGMEVVLTRDSDVFISLNERVRICNRENPDLFISMHINASRSRSANGVETYFARETLDDLVRARNASGSSGSGDYYMRLAMAHTLFDMSRCRSIEIGAKVQESLHQVLSSADRGVKGAGFRVLKGAMCPALLLEIGFISNPDTERKLRSSKYLDSIVRSIVSAI